MDKNKVSKFLEKLQFNFKDISDLKPEEKQSASLSLMKYVDDKTVHNFNPKRYNFYMQFIEALNNPTTLKNVLYSNTLIKAKKEVEMESIRKIVNGLQSLYMVKPLKTETNQNYIIRKNNKKTKINTNVINRIGNLMNDDIDSANKEPIKNIINNTFIDPSYTKGGGGNDDNNLKLSNNTDTNIIGLFYNKMIDDINQITDNLRVIIKKKKDIDEFLKTRKENNKNKLRSNAIDRIEEKDSGLIDAPNMNFLKQSTGLIDDARNGDKTISGVEDDLRYPLKNFTRNVNDIIGIRELSAPVFEKSTEQPPHVTTPETEKTKGKETGKETAGGMILDDAQYQKLNDLVFDIENDIMRPITKLDISREDRVIFIVVTFFIRFISLSFVEWGMNTNFVSTFEQTFSFYCIIYITLFGLITMIVNVIYNYPLQQLYTDRSIVNIQSMLYYFYIYTNGPTRLILHLLFIIILMIIPFVIKISNNQSDSASFDYLQKKNTRKSLSMFTFIIWIITSVIAMRY